MNITTLMTGLPALLITLAFFTVTLIYEKYTRKYNLITHLAIATTFIISQIITNKLLTGSWGIIPLIVTGASILLFLALIFFIGNKVSGSNILIISATLGLSITPLALISFIVALATAVIYYSIKTLKATDNTIGALMTDVAFQTGILDGQFTGENIPTQELATSQRVSIITPILIIYTLTTITQLAVNILAN